MSDSDPPVRADARRNRELVVDVAMELLARKPEAPMREIADASGVGRTTVYRHFPTRDDLLRAIFERIGDEGRSLVVAALVAGGSAEDVLRRLGVGIAGIGARYRFLEAHRELGQQTLRSKVVEEDDPLLAWIHAAHARGELAPALAPDWIQAMVSPLAIGANEELLAGRVDEAEAGRLLGETFVRAFVADRGQRS